MEQNNLDNEQLVKEIKQITESVDSGKSNKELMDARDLRDTANFAETLNQQKAEVVAEVLAKKYPGVLFDALKDRMTDMDKVMGIVKKEIKEI